MHIQGLPNSIELSGVSRWPQISHGEDIPPHDSFAAGMHQLAHSVYRAPYLFAREKSGVGMETFHTVASGAREVLYDTTTGETYRTDFPEVVVSLRESLDAWLREERIDG
jgi:hypothetical protein